MKLEPSGQAHASWPTKRDPASILKVPISDRAAMEIARRSRGTPRIANALLRRVRDFAQVRGNGAIDTAIAQMSLTALNIDSYGLDEIDNKILLMIIQINLNF